MHEWWLMRWIWPVLVVCVVSSCAGLESPQDLLTMDPFQDQRRIAMYYGLEAARLHQKVEELTDRAAAYELLFGPDSDWVRGTRLLATFYKETAKEQERMATQHMNLSQRGQPYRFLPESR